LTDYCRFEFCGESLHDHLIYPAQFDQLAFEDSKSGTSLTPACSASEIFC
jgi:hypothetical protein